MKQYTEFKTLKGWYRMLNEKLFYDTVGTLNLEEMEEKKIIQRMA